MEPFTTTTDEIADGIYRFSTLIPDVSPEGFTFNQFLIRGEQPLLFHTGARMLYPLVSEAVAKVIPLDSLRWVSFGHVESDECGSMNMWLAAAPEAQVAFGALGCMVSLDDMCDRPPRPLEEGEVLDLGGKRVRQISTPHVPHGWEAQVLLEEAMFHATALTTQTAATIRGLGDLGPSTLAIMHGSSYQGDGKAALHSLADAYEGLVAASA
jgi:flavorubredoxin